MSDLGIVFTVDGCVRPSEDENITIVNLISNYEWMSAKGIHSKRSLIFMRRQCKGDNILEDEFKEIGVDLSRIKNLDGLADGLYRVYTCDHKFDWETGYPDDWNYKLVKE